MIAHRGYKVNYPENTIRAFEEAVEAGAHALETDLHLTKEGVVVLSHVNSFLVGNQATVLVADHSFRILI